jgi:hypothetical protein
MFGRRRFDPKAFISPAPELNDCDLEAQQLAKIIAAGYKNPTKSLYETQWKDEDGNVIPADVYM